MTVIRADQPKQSATQWILITVVAIVCMAMLAVAMIGWGRYLQLRDMVSHNCQGQVATLDLVEWVDVCRMVLPAK